MLGIMLGRLLILIFLIIPNTLAFCQWEFKSIKLPVVQSINHDFELIMDSIIEIEKNCNSFMDSSIFYIHATKLPKDTATLYLYITRPFNIDIFLYDLDTKNIAVTKHKEHPCFIYHDDFPDKLFDSTDDFKIFSLKRYKQPQKRKKNQILVLTDIEVDESYWKYYFYKDAFYLIESINYCQ